MVYFTFKTRFNAVHKLWNDDLTGEENRRLFGECANEAGHGHLYRLEVTVAAPVTSERPFVIERRSIQKVVGEVVFGKLHDKDMDTAFGTGALSTGENVARAIFELVEAVIDRDVRLVSVRLVETAKNSFLYVGEAAAGRLPRHYHFG